MITVVVPTIPPRKRMLARAVASVMDQTFPAHAIAVPVDVEKQGAAVNRQRGLEMVTTDWVAFLDDDDYFYPEHLEKLMACAQENDSDYVFSWYDVEGGTDPRAEEFGRPWDDANPRQTTITTLVRTELAHDVGGFLHDDETLESLTHVDRLYHGEDWLFTSRILEAGGRITHLPEKTWCWSHHGSNTSGLPKNW